METDKKEGLSLKEEERSGKKERIESLVTWLVRLLIGFVFVFSGFAKAIDPWGTLYKVDAYLAALDLDVWANLKLVAVFGLCSLEFVVGVFIVFGCFRKSIPIVGMAIMLFMLPLSLWIAISNPVDDCGCFGDLLKISNWATFWKNIVITAGMLWLIRFNSRCHWLVTPALQWISFVATGIFILVIELFGYISQPLLDFRPYKTGEYLVDDVSVEEDVPSFIFVYEKDGVKKEFKETDVLPSEDEGWVFVDRKEVVAPEVNKQRKDGKNLRIWDKEGEEDVTDQAIRMDGKQLLIMMPELEDVSPATTWQLNSLYEWSQKNNVEMSAVVSGDSEEIADWEDLSMASYPIYTADDTQIKEVVRGNPGVVYLENGKVEWKITLAAMNIDDFQTPGTSSNAMTFAFNNAAILRNCTMLYIIVLALLVFLSFTPTIKSPFRRLLMSEGTRADSKTVEK